MTGNNICPLSMCDTVKLCRKDCRLFVKEKCLLEEAFKEYLKDKQ